MAFSFCSAFEIDLLLLLLCHCDF